MAVDWSVIEKLEGKGIKKAYVPLPDTSWSGVTVASGVDLGQQTEASLASLCLSPALYAKLKPYLGHKKQAAVEFLKTKPLILTDEEVHELDTAIRKRFLKEVSQAYGPNWDKLSDAMQTVLMSVSYQYGVGLAKKCPKFYGACRANDPQAVIAELRNFGDKYGKRRNQEADYLEAANTKVTAAMPAQEASNGPWVLLWRLIRGIIQSN